MGWSSGSGILSDLWEDIREYVPEDKRRALFGKLADIFWNHDCDTLYEIMDDHDWPEVEPALRDIGYLTEDDE